VIWLYRAKSEPNPKDEGVANHFRGVTPGRKCCSQREAAARPRLGG
jgi:hypothetical protein